MGKSFAIKRFFFCKWKRELVRELVISHTEWDDGPIFEFWNGYFPQYTKENLKWYERDGLLTYYDLLKYKGRSRDSEKSLNNITVINVNIIDNEWKGYRMGKTKKKYKAITSKDFKSYPEKEKEKTVSCVASTGRKDLWVQWNIMMGHFKNVNCKLFSLIWNFFCWWKNSRKSFNIVDWLIFSVFCSADFLSLAL